MEKRFVYADNAATTPMSETAFNAMKPWLTENYGNPSSLYRIGRAAKEALNDARTVVGKCLNAAEPVDGRKVKGTIHWVSAEHAIDADLYLYDNLFTLENVNDVPEGTDYLDYLNLDSLKKLTGCKLEPSLADAKEGERFQFVRMGYYCKDRESGRFNRIVTLKDSFAKTLKK